SLPVLHDASVASLVSVYDFMVGPVGHELVEKAWERCEVKQWNLSAKCLTSKAAQMALNDYLRTHPALHNEIKERTGVVHGLEDDQLDDSAGTVDDDADVPSSVVIHAALGLDVAEKSAEVDTVPHCVDHAESDSEDLALVAAGEEENILLQ
ncbi:hypothetical protein EV363DRAFT_1180822, partial [Boletus edulis]